MTFSYKIQKYGTAMLHLRFKKQQKTLYIDRFLRSKIYIILLFISICLGNSLLFMKQK